MKIYSLWHVNTTLYFILASKICSSFQNKFHINHSFLTLEVWQWYALRNSDTKLLCVYKPKGPSPTSIASVSHSVAVVSDSLQPHGLQHASFPVRHQLPELAQTHVHRVSDAINKHSLLSSIYLVSNLWIIHIPLFQLLRYICIFCYLLLLT